MYKTLSTRRSYYYTVRRLCDNNNNNSKNKNSYNGAMDSIEFCVQFPRCYKTNYLRDDNIVIVTLVPTYIHYKNII